MTHEFETLVVGSGPAGIAAAVCAAEHGVRVGLIDDNPRAGGQIWRGSSDNSCHGSAAKWRGRLLASRVTCLHGWSVFDQPSPLILRAERNGEAADMHFEKLILATGARERFLPFPGWTLPNVMGVGAMQAMVKSGLPIRGKRIAIAGSGPLLLAVAAFLKSTGAEVVCICEQASMSQLLPFALALTRTPGKIVECLRYKAAASAIPFHTSAWPLQATGDSQVRAVTLSVQGKVRQIDCDYLACAFHLVPNTELPALTGCELNRCEPNQGAVIVDKWQQTSVPRIYCAGEPTGIGGLELSLIEGQIAGLAVAGQKIKAQALFGQREKFARFAARLSRAFALRPELKALATENTLLCRCEDVAYGAVRQHQSWREAKLHTRCGMGPCQGRICGSAVEFLLGWNASSVRPPIFPALISSLASSRATPNPNFKMHTKYKGDSE
jgi:NADPH-dependent 2,4-dienoyl-CoA reductase/sulfur reductase-like enzyme